MTDKIGNLRNIAFVGHGGAGKTSLTEVMLFNNDVINRLGRVEDGNTALDFEPEEIKRRISLSSGFHQFNWKNTPYASSIHPVTRISFPTQRAAFKLPMVRL